MTNYFFSALVIDSGPYERLQIVSLALVNELGEAYYSESREYDIRLAPEAQRTAIPHNVDQTNPKSLETIAQEAQAFVGHRWPTFWGWNGAQEFTAFYQLFFKIGLPDTWPRHFHELEVELDRDGNPRPPRMDEMSDNHHALDNARWIRETYIWLQDRRLYAHIDEPPDI